MTEPLRAVLDTNIFVSALLSRNPSSPTRELMQRWRNGEFTLLICDQLLAEVVEKLLAHDVPQQKIEDLVTATLYLAERVDVPERSIAPLIVADPDDDVILACALIGKADYLVSYDPHFDILDGLYKGVRICRALPFLWAVRGDQPPESS